MIQQQDRARVSPWPCVALPVDAGSPKTKKEKTREKGENPSHSPGASGCTGPPYCCSLVVSGSTLSGNVRKQGAV